MHAHDLPAGYGDESTLDAVFHALAQRLSRPSPIADALPLLHARSGTLQRHFDAFFPDLVDHASVLRTRLLA
jgi:acyl carrier protein phosphodiesterase